MLCVRLLFLSKLQMICRNVTEDKSSHPKVFLKTGYIGKIYQKQTQQPVVFFEKASLKNLANYSGKHQC